MTSSPLPPTHGTPRRPDRATFGHVAAAIAQALGAPLDPTQQYIADVALEVHDGRLAYSRIILSLPRRAGKSFLVFVLMLTRAYLGLGPQRVWYTAQNGTNVTKLWRQEWAPLLSTSSLGPRWTFRASQGHEEFHEPDRATFISAFSPKRDALHGQSGDVVVFDECFAHTADLGADLIQAAGPLLATRRSPQLIFSSAAGDIDSTWWHELLDTLRTSTAVDIGTGVAGFEWSAEAALEQGADETDPDLWRSVHPAVHHGRIRPEFLADEYAADPILFRRQYLNITDRTSVGNRAPIDPDVWRRLAVAPAPLPRHELVTFGVDCAAEQSHTSITAARIGADDLPVVELVEYGEGWLWAVDRLADLCDRYDVAGVGLDTAGQSPAVVLEGPLRRAGVPVRPAGLADVTAAAARLSADVAAGTIRQVPHPRYDAAVESARRRPIGDGAWTFGRLVTGEDVSPLISAMFALSVHPNYTGRSPAIG